MLLCFREEKRSAVSSEPFFVCLRLLPGIRLFLFRNRYGCVTEAGQETDRQRFSALKWLKSNTIDLWQFQLYNGTNAYGTDHGKI